MAMSQRGRREPVSAVGRDVWPDVRVSRVESINPQSMPQSDRRSERTCIGRQARTTCGEHMDSDLLLGPWQAAPASRVSIRERRHLRRAFVQTEETNAASSPLSSTFDKDSRHDTKEVSLSGFNMPADQSVISNMCHAKRSESGLASLSHTWKVGKLQLDARAARRRTTPASGLAAANNSHRRPSLRCRQGSRTKHYGRTHPEEPEIEEDRGRYRAPPELAHLIYKPVPIQQKLVKSGADRPTTGVVEEDEIPGDTESDRVVCHELSSGCRQGSTRTRQQAEICSGLLTPRTSPGLPPAHIAFAAF